MKYFQIFVKLIPFLFDLIRNAEFWFSDVPKSGAEKKASVLEAAGAIVDGIVATVTGGASDTWVKIRPLVEKTVDVICGFIFK